MVIFQFWNPTFHYMLIWVYFWLDFYGTESTEIHTKLKIKCSEIYWEREISKLRKKCIKSVKNVLSILQCFFLLIWVIHCKIQKELIIQGTTQNGVRKYVSWSSLCAITFNKRQQLSLMCSHSYFSFV